MLIKEYRILLPLTVDEYRIAQLYMIQKKSRLDSSGTGSGVEIITNEPYDKGPGGSGQYTYKIYHIEKRIPAWIRSVLPATALEAHEESWNAYPFTKTRYKCPLMDRLGVEVETHYFNDAGTQDNVFQLSVEELKNRVIDVMDFVNDPVSSHDYCAEEDPKRFRSEKTSRGPLTANWVQEHLREGRPVMCAYKLCRVEFRYWGLQTRAERWIHDLALRNTMLHAHRQAWAWQDEWVDLTMADIRRLEEDVARYLSNVMANSDDSAEADATTASPKDSDRKSEENTPKKMAISASESKEPSTSSTDHSSSGISSHKRPDSHQFTASGSGRSGKPAAGLHTSEEEDDDDSKGFLSPPRSSRANSKTNSAGGGKDASAAASRGNDDDESIEEDVFFDCYDQPNLSVPKSSKTKPALIRWSSELLLDVGEEDEAPLVLTPKPDPNSALLILIFHGDIFPDNPADSKTTDTNALHSTLEHIIKSHYPQLKARFHLLQISCGKELASTFTQLKCVSSHFNVFHPSFALLLASHRQTFELAVQSTIKAANAAVSDFLKSDAGASFRNADIFAIGDYVGGLLMYEALAKWPSSSLKGHRQVTRNYSSISVYSDDHSRERDASTCSLFEYNISEGVVAPSGPTQIPPSASNNNSRSKTPVEKKDSTSSLNNSHWDSSAGGIGTPLHKTVIQKASLDRNSRNLSAPPSANFRPPTALARLSTSSTEANDNWPSSANHCETLSFKPNTAFLLGCPLALVLMQRKLLGKDVRELECEQLFNLYYPLDFCAGRLEPVLNAQLAALPPLSVPRYQRNRPAGGGGRQFFFDNVLETPMLWGNRRVDHELYCPPEMISLPSAALPNILHASYWESKDVGEFILRQFVRADNADYPDAQSASINATSNLSMDCEIPPKAWNRRRTRFKIANLNANHRANDLIIIEDGGGSNGGQQEHIHARFCYGPMDLVALSLENILVYVRPMGGKWTLNSREMTNTHGRLTVHLNHTLPVGVHEVRMIVQGDRSFLNMYVAVAPPATEVVVFSIDGSLTGSVSVTGRDPRVKPGAVDVVRYWQQQGYLIIYVTARPDMQQRFVANWLAQHNFPHGLLYFTPSISTDPLKQKAQLLRQLLEQKLKIHAVYGSAKDVHVYATVGIESERIFRVGASSSSKKRSNGCVALEDGYAHHLHSIHSGEVKVARPASATVSTTAADADDNNRGASTAKNPFAQQRHFMHRTDSFTPRSGKYASFNTGNKKGSQISIST